MKASRLFAPAVLLLSACRAVPRAEATRYPPSRPDDIVMTVARPSEEHGRATVPTVGGDDALAYLVSHRDGRIWPGFPVEFDVTNGSRGFSIEKGKGPYICHVVVLTDESGAARACLQPLPMPQ